MEEGVVGRVQAGSGGDIAGTMWDWKRKRKMMNKAEKIVRARQGVYTVVDRDMFSVEGLRCEQR